MREEFLSLRPGRGPRNYDADMRRMGMRIDALTEQLGTALIRIAELEKGQFSGRVITKAKGRKAA